MGERHGYDMKDGKLRILHFSIANTKSGVTQYIMNHWRFIDREKFHFDFATFSKALDDEEKIIREGSKIYHIGTYAEVDEGQFCAEVRGILKNGYDVVHLHTSNWSSFLLEHLAREENIPRIIVHSHNSDIHNSYGKSREEARKKHLLMRGRLSEDTATDYWACSWKAADWLYGNRIPEEKIVIMKNAIDVDKFLFQLPLREQMRRKWGLDDCFVIGHVGRFEYQKNHKFLIDVFARLKDEIPEARLALIGDGSLRRDMEETVSGYHMEDKVLFCGKQEEVEKWYQAMDAFVLPSHFEGLPLSLIEAQAADLPCLASEHVSKEVKVSCGIEFLGLDEEVWCAKLKKIYGQGNGTRQNRKQVMSDAGYDLKSEIKVLEKRYLAGAYKEWDK